MHHQHPKNLNEKPASASSKAGRAKSRKGRRQAEMGGVRRAELAQQALANAVQGESLANYQAIFDGFAAMGIDMADVKPRENVFTFNAWLALGRVVRKGEHGVKVVTIIPCTKKDEETGEEIAVRKPKATTVFHITQTEPKEVRQ